MERYKYCHLSTAQTVTMVWVVQPKDKFFVAGMPKLNLVGLYHLKSYVLQHVGILTMYVEDVEDSCCMLHALCRIMSKTLKILNQAITDF